MRTLTADQRILVRNFLTRQGLTFEPLLEEMLDHVSSDLEERMEQGQDFEEAWRETRNEIPEHHLQTIQFETMETINKRFTISRTFSFVALGMLLAGTIFKILHLSGGGELMLLSFAAMAAALLSSTVSGIYIHKEKKGAIRILSIVAGIILLMTGYGFKLLHLLGADFLIILGVAISIASLLLNTLYIYRSSSSEVNLLSYLHEKYTPSIERFFLLLLVPVGIYSTIILLQSPGPFLGAIALIIVIYGAGAQFLALVWRRMEKDLAQRTAPILAATILSCICLSLPFLGPILPLEVRLVLIGMFSIVTAWLAYKMDTQRNVFVLVMVCLVPVVFTGRTLLGLHVLPEANAGIIFNIPVLLLLAAGVFISKKHESTRAFLILSLASYILEYSVIVMKSNP